MNTEITNMDVNENEFYSINILINYIYILNITTDLVHFAYTARALIENACFEKPHPGWSGLPTFQPVMWRGLIINNMND